MRRGITGILVAALLMLVGVSGFTASSWAETGSTGVTRSVEVDCEGGDCLDEVTEEESKCPDDDAKCLQAIDEDEDFDDEEDCWELKGRSSGDCVEEITTPGGSFSAVASAAEDAAGVRFGNNLLLAGNELRSSVGINGLLFAAGYRVDLSTDTEYGFFAGNIVNISSWTDRDLFAAGNVVTLKEDANIGRDAYLAGGTVIIEADLDGDLSVAAGTVELRGVAIGGNLNIDAENIIFKGATIVDGVTNYNEDATVSDLNNLRCDTVKVYQQERDTAQDAVALWSSKILSMATLFLTTILIFAVVRRLYPRVLAVSEMSQFGNNIGLGVAALLLAPLLGIIALCTFFLAPLGISIIVVWLIAIYLAQGFAGIWLGHMLVTHILKSKGSFAIDALVGIVVLGILSLVPFVGVATGFLGLTLGLGLIVQCFRRQTEQKDMNIANDPGNAEAEKPAPKQLEPPKNAPEKTAKKPKTGDTEQSKDNKSKPKDKDNQE